MSALPVRVGTDIVCEQDISALAENGTALAKVFTAAEIEQCGGRREDRLAALARCLAAKEALLKATGRTLADLSQIEISHLPDGRPVANWSYLTENGLVADVSVTSSSPFAIAVAIVLSLQ